MSKKILVIDDHPETLNVVTYILKQRGYEILGAQSGKEGLKVAEEERPDLFILDVMMPELNGYEVCRRLRAQPHFAKTPIIMFTAKTQVNDKLAGFEAGADDYLTKPTDPAELNRRVGILLSREVADTDDDNIEPNEPVHHPHQNTPSSKGTLVAVAGARGGAGTTTIAINLAATLAAAERHTTLVDFDTTQGHIALYLKKKVRGGLNALAQYMDWELSQEIEQHLQEENSHLQLLLSHYNLDGNLPTLSQKQVATVVDYLCSHNKVVVADIGTGANTICLPVLEQAAHIILCVKPERIAISAARQFIHNLKHELAVRSTIHVIMLVMGEKVPIPKAGIEDFLNYPLAGVINIDHQEISDIAKSGQPLVALNPESPAAAVFRKIGEQLQIEA